jgi:hypothetical protein
MTLPRVVLRMVRRKALLLAPFLLLGTFVALSGSAAALATPGTCSMQFHDGSGPDVFGLVFYGLGIANNVLDFARATLPHPEAGNATTPTSSSSAERICVNFLNVCGPIESALLQRV